MFLYHSTKESHSCLSISSVLKEYIDHFTILVYCSPQVMLFALNLDEHLIYEESITISLMSSTQSGCVFRTELVTPQSD